MRSPLPALLAALAAPIAVAGATTTAARGAAAPAAPSATPTIEATAGAAQPTPRFSVRYTGTSHVDTIYRSQPPNPGGKSDRNRVHDTSRQRWALDFTTDVALPDCTADPAACDQVTGPQLANGKTSASGRIDHTHVDGLYRNLDSAAHCSVKARHIRTTGLVASIDVRRDRATGTFVVTARNPVQDALTLLPPSCPGLGDSLDLLLDNYFSPGFSFATGYGPDVWYTSAAVAIPDATWRSSTRIRLRLGPTQAGTPPRDCAVLHRKFEQCRTSSGWSGVLTFTRR